ncbi:uncharacterized protein LOC123302684 [Chrysoperla carnea]|uniref:uncharacterized protein LOC123302684 n=1 Tax=Chrysoperla carnea TaxID=189513 RepID=UPI001D09914E|nr:uncharacterized protein LOC123302684 [Chrysoperla carnea]
MLEFVGSRSKMYAIRVQNKKETKRSKGLKKSAIRKLTFEDYKRCLLENRNFYRVQQSIKSKRHRLHTIKQQKVGLSPYDQKRYITHNSCETKPWGHYSIICSVNVSCCCCCDDPQSGSVL